VVGEYEESDFDPRMTDGLLRSFGLEPPRRRSTARPGPRFVPPKARAKPKPVARISPLAPPRIASSR